MNPGGAQFEGLPPGMSICNTYRSTISRDEPDTPIIIQKIIKFIFMIFSKPKNVHKIVSAGPNQICTINYYALRCRNGFLHDCMLTVTM